VIKQKMTEAQLGFNDSLSFTELSKGCLDTFKDQYLNVYSKGMLISMCLDLKLLHLSDGKYGLMNLIHDLAKSYGKDRAFKDEELIPKIVSLTYPEIKTFFDDYVIGGKKLPFEEVLGYAGVDYTAIKKNKAFTLGQADLGYNPATKKMMVVGVKNMNDFGKALGYEEGDELEKINGQKITLQDFRSWRQHWVETVKEGDKVKIQISRTTPDNKKIKVTLKAKAFMADVKTYNVIGFNPSPTPEQLKIRKAWLEPAK